MVDDQFLKLILSPMSTQVEREAEDAYEAENDRSPVPGHENDNSYVTDQAQVPVPVVADEAEFEDPMIPHEADTDQQLGMIFH